MMCAVVRPTVSRIWNGPFGAPVPRVHARSMLCGSLTQFAYRSIAENSIGTSMELSRYPDFSLRTGSGIMRICAANAMTASNAAGLVFGCAMISAVLFFQMEFAKCSAR